MGGIYLVTKRFTYSLLYLLTYLLNIESERLSPNCDIVTISTRRKLVSSLEPLLLSAQAHTTSHGGGQLHTCSQVQQHRDTPPTAPYWLWGVMISESSLYNIPPFLNLNYSLVHIHNNNHKNLVQTKPKTTVVKLSITLIQP